MNRSDPLRVHAELGDHLVGDVVRRSVNPSAPRDRPADERGEPEGRSVAHLGEPDRRQVVNRDDPRGTARGGHHEVRPVHHVAWPEEPLDVRDVEMAPRKMQRSRRHRSADCTRTRWELRCEHVPSPPADCEGLHIQLARRPTARPWPRGRRPRHPVGTPSRGVASSATTKAGRRLPGPHRGSLAQGQSAQVALGPATTDLPLPVASRAVITALAGGVGAARLLTGLVPAVDAGEVTAIVNTGDDTVIHGLHVSPDLDTVSYTLSGRSDDERGWGLAGETWVVMDALERLGGETWLRLGDHDLATHLYRTKRLDEGATLSEVTRELCSAFGVPARLVPMSDDPVRTRMQLRGRPRGRVPGLLRQAAPRGPREQRPVRRRRRPRRPAPGVLDAIRECGRRGHLPFEPDLVDRPAARRSRDRRCRRLTARRTRSRSRRSSRERP